MWRMMKVESAAPHSFREPEVRVHDITSAPVYCRPLSAPISHPSIHPHDPRPPSPHDQIRWQRPQLSPVSSSALLPVFSSSSYPSRPQPGRMCISSMPAQGLVEFDSVYSVTLVPVPESVMRSQLPSMDTSEPSIPLVSTCADTGSLAMEDFHPLSSAT